MHSLVDSELLRRFMRTLGSEPGCAGRVYITGGGSAVLVGILRGQEKDLGDVAAMIERGLIDPPAVWAL
jgi:hypothetical protein